MPMKRSDWPQGRYTFQIPALISDQFEVMLKIRGHLWKKQHGILIPKFKLTSGVNHMLLLDKSPTWHEFEDILKKSMWCLEPYSRAWHLKFERLAWPFS